MKKITDVKIIEARLKSSHPGNDSETGPKLQLFSVKWAKT